MKLGRNEECWCHSKKKYKNCHLRIDERLEQLKEQGKLVPGHEIIKNEKQIAGIREAGKLNTEILDRVSEFIKEGISTEEINHLVHEYTISHGGIPAPLGYEGYPKSVCVSIDEVVCHGIPDKNRILKQGEIVNVDVTTILNGYFADASRMFCIGDVGQEKQKLVEFTKECLELGVQAAKPWGYLGDIGYVISQHAYENGYSVVREIGGHGVGLEFHEEPWVSHIGEPNTDMILVPGMIFTIEPMINIGAEDVYEDEKDGWTIRTKDGKPSAQWEYTLLITETGNEILTW
ncbi:MAG: methionyl aminopeptidase [Lachnospiraceae bacterium]|nr:methionyl aminopeptidase [Lachnospiraceae bacterium]